MFQKLQKKPFITRKKIMVGGVVIITILLLPIWFWSVIQSITHRAPAKPLDPVKAKQIKDIQDKQEKLFNSIQEMQDNWENYDQLLTNATSEEQLLKEFAPASATPDQSIINLPPSPNL